MDVTIEEAGEITPEICAAMARLVPQLSASASVPDRAQLEAIAASPATVLLLARDGGGQVVGCLTLAVFRIPTGVRAWIEDVVVDGAARGHGVGETLCRAAIARAGAFGARTVDLTSRPSREAANRLYLKLGFVRRETNVYRLEI